MSTEVREKPCIVSCCPTIKVSFCVLGFDHTQKRTLETIIMSRFSMKRSHFPRSRSPAFLSTTFSHLLSRGRGDQRARREQGEGCLPVHQVLNAFRCIARPTRGAWKPLLNDRSRGTPFYSFNNTYTRLRTRLTRCNAHMPRQKIKKTHEHSTMMCTDIKIYICVHRGCM